MTKTEIERLSVVETQADNILKILNDQDVRYDKALASQAEKLDILDGKIDAILLTQARGAGATSAILKAMPFVFSAIAIIVSVVPK